MGKFITGNRQYVVYARNSQEASQVLLQELNRFDEIKAKMASLLSEDGRALQNFLTNTSEENLHIQFNDETSLIYDIPGTETTKGEVRHQREGSNAIINGKGDFVYELAYRYPEIRWTKCKLQAST